jgi:sugar phosphate isomerase/epimerase
MKLSVQLYTVRDAMSEDPIGTLKRLKEIGLNYVEGGPTIGADTAAESKKILEDLGLQVSGAHIALNSLENSLDEAIENVKALGCDYVILPWIDKDVYADGWEKFALRLNPIGKKVKDAGLSFCYHNHAFEFENDGFNTLYANADPEYVKAQLDIAWCQIGGSDPAEMIRTLKGRLPLVHLKDFDPARTPEWTPAGQGKVDWLACLGAIAEGNVEFGAIELDLSPGDPLEAVEESVNFFRAKGISE